MQLALRIIAILIFLTGTFNAMAKDDADGNELIANCTVANEIINGRNTKPTSIQSTKASYCMGLLTGVIRSIQDVSVMSNVPALRNIYGCTGDIELEIGEASLYVVNWLRNHPEYLHLDDHFLISMALSDKYPCK